MMEVLFSNKDGYTTLAILPLAWKYLMYIIIYNLSVWASAGWWNVYTILYSMFEFPPWLLSIFCSMTHFCNFALSEYHCSNNVVSEPIFFLYFDFYYTKMIEHHQQWLRWLQAPLFQPSNFRGRKSLAYQQYSCYRRWLFQTHCVD